MFAMYLAIKIIMGGEKGVLQYILFTISVVLLFGLREYAIISVLGSIVIYQMLYKKFFNIYKHKYYLMCHSIS